MVGWALDFGAFIVIALTQDNLISNRRREHNRGRKNFFNVIALIALLFALSFLEGQILLSPGHLLQELFRDGLRLLRLHFHPVLHASLKLWIILGKGRRPVLLTEGHGVLGRGEKLLTLLSGVIAL